MFKLITKAYRCLILICSILTISACSEDADPGPGMQDADDMDSESTLSAAFNANSKQAAPGDEVALGFSSSVAPDGAQYSITYVSGPADIVVSESTFSPGSVVLTTEDKTSAFTFTPNVTGIYAFQLAVSADGESSTDDVTVNVAGITILTSDFLSSLSVLPDVDAEFGNVDYKVNDCITLDNSLTISAGVVIEFEPEGGLIIDNEATLTYTSTLINQTNEFKGTAWKGILIKDGTLDLADAMISGAGASSFDGYDPAVITVDNGELNLFGTIFENSSGINLNVLENGSLTSVSTNLFDLKEAIHTSFFEIGAIESTNNYDATDALVTLKGEGDTFISVAGDISVNAGPVDYRVTGGVTFSSPIDWFIEFDQTVFMEENTGINISGGGTIQGAFGNSESTITGEDGASWKGIYHSGGTFEISRVIIDKAGSGTHTGTDEPAALYYNTGNLSTGVIKIENSEGYGFYFGPNAELAVGLSASFSGNQLEDIVIPFDAGLKMIRNASIPDNDGGVLLLDQRFTNTAGTLPDLGPGNFYFIKESIDLTTGLTSAITIEEGVDFAFSPEGSLTIAVKTNAIGTADNPITFNSIDNTSKWGGLSLQNSINLNFDFDHVQISNGGGFQVGNATELANLILNRPTTNSGSFSFTNCTVSDSEGYGVLIEAGSFSYDFEAMENNNSFSGNLLGDVNDKTL